MTKLTTTDLTRWLRFKHLKLLVILGECRNMHQAAEQMYMSQPAASKMLKELESFFGFKLFDRLPRSMTATEMGHEVLSHAQLLLNDAERLVEEINLMREGGHGKIMIGVIPAAAPEILPAAIVALKQRRPRLAISIKEHSSDHLLADLEQKRLDIVIGRLTQVDQHNIFNFEELLEEPLCIVVRRDHPLAGTTEVELLDLCHREWILHPIKSPMRGVFEKGFEEAGVTSPTNIIETTSIQVTLKLLETSNMLAVMPQSVLNSFLNNNQLVRLPIQIGELFNHYGIITRKKDTPPEGVIELINALREQIKTIRDQ